MKGQYMRNLDAIFSPGSVAVVGASTTPGKVGHDIFVNILKGGYKGILYPVNPASASVASVRAYAAIAEIPDSLDLAMIILPPRAALSAVKDAIAKGVRGIVIVSAGFKEIGGEGAAIEKQIVGVCREAGVRLVGPNCLGVINPLPDVALNASFSARMPKGAAMSPSSLKVVPCARLCSILPPIATSAFPNSSPSATRPMWMKWTCCAISTRTLIPK
jgi:acetate---CoA ligase (ADP-forming)